MRFAQGNGLMAVLCVIHAVAADAGNAFVGRNLAQQRWQDRCIADAVVGHLHGTDVERGRVDPDVHLTPLAPVIRIMLLVFHSPSPSILMPVLSTSRCKPVVVGTARLPLAAFSAAG